MKTINVIIETPKNSLAKYSYDQLFNSYKLKKILPPGLTFPFDFGFIPQTKGEDGDPLDVIVLNEHPTFPGCMIECCIVGAITAVQSKKKKMIRNDRLLAVAILSKLYAHVITTKKIPEDIVHPIQQFFIDYNKLEGKTFKPLKIINQQDAYKLLQTQKQS
jgi:inorganic pyrophosphatase